MRASPPKPRRRSRALQPPGRLGVILVCGAAAQGRGPDDARRRRRRWTSEPVSAGFPGGRHRLVDRRAGRGSCGAGGNGIPARAGLRRGGHASSRASSPRLRGEGRREARFLSASRQPLRGTRDPARGHVACDFPTERMISWSSWAAASAGGAEAGRRRAPLSCGPVGVASQQGFSFPPGPGGFRFHFPLAPPPFGIRPASGSSDGQCDPIAAAAASAMALTAVIAEVTQVLCAAGGALEVEELRRRLRDGFGADKLERLLREGRRFAVATRARGAAASSGSERVVVAVSALRLCRGHQGLKPTCLGLCGELHFCKFMVLGACKFLKTGEKCKNNHSLTTDHNMSVLKTHGVDHLSYSELCQLLFQNDPWLLPEICLHYNKGDGPHGSCSFQKKCIKLHVCQYFLQSECKFGTGCKRSHNLSNSENLEKLQKFGMSSELVHRLPSIYRNAHDIKNRSSAPGPQRTSERRDSSGSVSSSITNQEETDQICLFHIWKSCGFRDKCCKVHFHLPYRWQFLDGGRWKDLDKMELIEEAYSNPHKERVSCTDLGGNFHNEHLNFKLMRFGIALARRLSTASSVTKPPHFILTTEWVWYWIDDFGFWQQYGKQGTEHPTTTVSSSDVEKAYQAYCASGSDSQAAILKFQAGKHKYELDFRDFTQKNLAFGTSRRVCRRPKYISPQDVKVKQTSSVKFQGPKNIPDHWDPSALPDSGFKLVTLSSSSEEYQKVYSLFNRTLPYYVQKIERIQNLALWEVYQWQKGQMQKKNGGKLVDERQLFHGTDEDFVNAICQQNFDWRICGLHGTNYGKGSYFARDAAYSHHYSKSNTKFSMMFLARVLVGEFTRGNASFLRPPAKEGQGSVFYDSCVNSMSDPSIFVIFEKHQIYPEYIIQYTSKPAARATPQPAPRIAPQPAPRIAPQPVAGASSLFSLASLFGIRQ